MDDDQAPNGYLAASDAYPDSFYPHHRAAIAQLLTKWMEAVDRYIWERSGSITEDERALVTSAKEQCSAIGIEWSDNLVPADIRERIAQDDEEAAAEAAEAQVLRDQQDAER